MSAMITLEGLSIGYQAQSPLATDINVEVQHSDVLALVGLNGSGKSTLLKTIMGLVKPLSGSVKLDVVRSHDIAYLPQQARIEKGFPIDLKEFVSTGLWTQTGWWRSMRNYDKEVHEAIERVGLSDMTKVHLSELSGGQMQRALFARMLLQPSKLLLLDEPFNGVDEATISVLLEQLKYCQEQGATIVAAIHDLELVKQHFDQCLLFHPSGLLQGNSKSLLDASNDNAIEQVPLEVTTDSRLDLLDHA
ncbi:ATP-binding cassette domain-containing protein [Marinomonas sp. S3726]|uniref:metal ABC transporter ATP-binding protein n=1 Tax=Marinomonas sp. S3726 TaxID=579484 RepID=UPI0005FA6750|nr:ATP-binding cassette domain-containing protein [Marinomonas sp. S3726]